MTTSDPTPFTLRSAAGLGVEPPPLAESVVIVIDAQREYGPDGALPLEGLASAIERTVMLVDQARSLQRPVIHVVHHGAPGGLFDLSGGGRVLPDVAPLAGEPVVMKRLPNAFAGTDLAEQIERMGKPPIVVAGFMTHMCVSATARAALDLGFATTVVSDATATRALPGAADERVVSADIVQRAALAALADRFAIVARTTALLS